MRTPHAVLSVAGGTDRTGARRGAVRSQPAGLVVVPVSDGLRRARRTVNPEFSAPRVGQLPPCRFVPHRRLALNLPRCVRRGVKQGWRVRRGHVCMST